MVSSAGIPEKADPDAVTFAMEQSLLAHYIPASLGLWTIGTLFLLFYPITEARHRENVARIKAVEAAEKARVVRDAGTT